MSDELLSQSEIEALLKAAQGGGEETPPQQDVAQASPAEAVADVQAEASRTPDVQASPEENIQPTITTLTPPKPKITLQYSDTVVRPAEFAPIDASGGSSVRNGVELILDVQLQVAVELGRASMKVKEVLGLGPGSVVELDKHAGEPVEVVVNNKIVARGEVVVIDENFGVRITEILSSSQRESYAKAA